MRSRLSEAAKKMSQSQYDALSRLFMVHKKDPTKFVFPLPKESRSLQSLDRLGYVDTEHGHKSATDTGNGIMHEFRLMYRINDAGIRALSG